jgi:hypothetical protein
MKFGQRKNCERQWIYKEIVASCLNDKLRDTILITQTPEVNSVNGHSVLFFSSRYIRHMSTVSHNVRWGGGWQYLHHSPASRKGRPSARGYKLATLFLGDINMGIWPSRMGSLRWDDEVWLRVLSDSRRLSDCTANCRPVLSSEKVPYRNTTATFLQQPSDKT